MKTLVALSMLFALTAPAATPAASAPAPRYGDWGFDVSGMDRATRPGDDFFQFADGEWAARTPIPPDRSFAGMSDALADKVEARLHAIMEAAARNPRGRGAQAKIGAAYRAYMDEAGIEARRTAPLQPDLAAIRATRSAQEMAALMGRSPGSYFASVLDLSIAADPRRPGRYQVRIGQGGLGLPDRDYYLVPDLAEKLTAYRGYVARMLRLAGWPDPETAAQGVVEFETRIARASRSQAEERDPLKSYVPVTVAGLEASTPGFPWTRYLAAAGLGRRRDFVLASGEAVAKIADIYDRTPLAVLQAWQAFHTADAAAEVLPHDFVVAQFEFRERTLAGQPQIQVRWKRAVKAVDGELGDAVGRLYVARYFPPRSKAQAQTLVVDLKAAFAARIRHLDWMSPDTKTQALAKLAAMEVQIGYPSRWRDYGGLAVRPDDPYGNATRAMAFDWAYQVRRLAGPVDRNAWELTPQTINAYNEPLLNVLVFPAAILQPPFFDPAADPAINFGGLGGVIGHEMTHGFDDQGRRFDARGGLRDWWAASDSARFEAQAKRLAAQYSALEALPGVHLNGELTLGENIADLGGLSIALDAYHASLRGKPAPTIDGFTGDQRVFLGWAQKWRQKLRPELLRQVVAADPHAPPTARVNGVVRNMDGWYGAYGVKPGDKLYLPPAERVRIW